MKKKILAVAVAGAIVAPTTVQAVKYKLSGQVNRAIVFADDGVQSDVRNVDNVNSSSRFRFRGSEDLGNGNKVGVYYEMQFQSVPSNGAGGAPDANADSDAFGIRHANVWFSGNWGKLTLGQGDGAGNGGTESDLGGTFISGNATYRLFSGGFKWRSTAPGGAPTGLTEANTYNTLDAFSRHDMVRYDSPALGPVVVSASMGNDQTWEAAGRVKTALGGGQLSGALFYGQSTGSRNIDNRWGGSVAYMFWQGTNFSVNYAQNEDEAGRDSQAWGVRLGHKWGPHAVGIGYQEANDINADGFTDTGWTAGYVHSLKKANTQLYAGFTHAELDTPAAFGDVEDHNLFAIGARVRFN